jgi:hypothetical protein
MSAPVSVEVSQVECMTITGAKALDPIKVFFNDTAPGQGHLIVECYCQAWAAYWGAMSDRTLRQFFMDCDAGYIANRLHTRGGIKEYKYILRIVEAIKKALTRGLADKPEGMPDEVPA